MSYCLGEQILDLLLSDPSEEISKTRQELSVRLRAASGCCVLLHRLRFRFRRRRRRRRRRRHRRVVWPSAALCIIRYCLGWGVEEVGALNLHRVSLVGAQWCRAPFFAARVTPACPFPIATLCQHAVLLDRCASTATTLDDVHTSSGRRWQRFDHNHDRVPHELVGELQQLLRHGRREEPDL